MRIPASLLLGLLLPGLLVGQSRRLSLQEAIRIALERNLSIQQADQTLELYEAQRRQRRANFLPYVSLDAASGLNQGRQFDLTTAQLTTQRSERLSASLDVTLNLFNGGADWASWQQSERELAAQQASLARTRQSVAFSVVQAFLQVLLDEELLRIERENLQTQRAQTERIEQLVRSGLRPASELQNQQAQLAQQELAVVEAENRLTLDRARLFALLRLEPDSAVAFHPPETSPEALLAEELDLQTLYEEALSLRPDYRQRLLLTEAARWSIRAATAGYLPRLDASFSYGSGYSSLARRFDPSTQRLERVGFKDQFWRENVYSSFGLRISIPVFDRLNTATNVTRSRIQYENARLELEQLRWSIQSEVQQALLAYRAAQKRLQATTTQLRAAEMALHMERERYETGSGTLLELTTANANYVRAASQHAQARYNVLLQRLALDYYVGRLQADLD
jgi:outer membrane protein|nr:MAG: transporter [Bacteroidota bacterium]